ncbi:Phospholipid-transporting ATPase 1 [Hordeum vulgare]|nr:Phospholipid-transporting ATPase 1 [Hordeum vulgare]
MMLPESPHAFSSQPIPDFHVYPQGSRFSGECSPEVGLDGFPLDHEFLEDYGLEEEDDDMDIKGEPLFEEELANQTVVGAKLKRKSKRTKAYMPAEDKLLCEC